MSGPHMCHQGWIANSTLFAFMICKTITMNMSQSDPLRLILLIQPQASVILSALQIKSGLTASGIGLPVTVRIISHLQDDVLDIPAAQSWAPTEIWHTFKMGTWCHAWASLCNAWGINFKSVDETRPLFCSALVATKMQRKIQWVKKVLLSVYWHGAPACLVNHWSVFV